MESKKNEIESCLDLLLMTSRPYLRPPDFRFDDSLSAKWQLQSKQDLTNHEDWELFKKILQDRSKVYEDYLGSNEFVPQGINKSNTLYIRQLKSLMIIYELQMKLFEKWISEQVKLNCEFNVRNILLRPFNIHFRHRLNEVHRYAVQVRIMPMKPLDDWLLTHMACPYPSLKTKTELAFFNWKEHKTNMYLV